MSVRSCGFSTISSVFIESPILISDFGLRISDLEEPQVRNPNSEIRIPVSPACSWPSCLARLAGAIPSRLDGRRRLELPVLSIRGTRQAWCSADVPPVASKLPDLKTNPAGWTPVFPQLREHIV